MEIFAGTASLDTVLIWLAAGAFLVGAIVNASGHPKIRAGFMRLGFPFWWCWVTAAFELVTGVLLVTAGTRYIGVTLGACIMLAAIAAIVRIRNYRELPPPLMFLLLLVLASVSGQI
ncbi:DoxX family protein [Rhizobium leucaenae]|uniref:Putative membrane protein YphA (DoxX/SURF4 family) n=1 Tax=Rhizobium leucaenae TaxID=29450 RepID=A0A7W6ZQC7_9HYPH|nr:DoxX family protein [Rhizobium leucaenae]MBB4566659.1 putative membrane protein YphA (DoxX/SURF4 family) [Rhizobium leucaenae]MBB6301446.1 putative membrane protein YphA (DoxX/SURF4 family) [Rhizobium leucaenae]